MAVTPVYCGSNVRIVPPLSDVLSSAVHVLKDDVWTAVAVAHYMP